MAEPHDKIMEERLEKMVSPTGGEPILRHAHFLSPSVTSIDGPVYDLPQNRFLESNTESNVKVNFRGWKYPQKDWKTWVDCLHSLHHFEWEKAGILEAIMNSTYRIHRNADLICRFAEKWCPETNTFVFPWGEATITLEDMMILGGHSVLGDPVFKTPETSDWQEIECKLLSARSELIKTQHRKASQSLWLPKFMDSGSEIEHEAFLALWLSRFVFPSKYSGDNVEKHVLPIAIHLARGTKIALAPAVLAILYTNLSELKEVLVASKGLQDSSKKDKVLELSLSAPFQLVQIWVWERFSTLQPKPITLKHGQPRFAKWNELRMEDTGDVRLAIDDAADHFRWRPYAMGCKSLVSHKIYKEKEEAILAGSGMDDEVELLVRCLRASELVGTDSNCITQYLPHRVAMQFGIDQDLPGHVARANLNKWIAWENYTRTVSEERLYIPPRLFESDVTTRYVEWWKKSMSALRVDAKPSMRGVNSKDLEKNMSLFSPESKSATGAPASPISTQKCYSVRAISLENKGAFANKASLKSLGKRVLLNSGENKSENDAPVSPGVPPKTNTVGTRNSEDKDGQTRAKRLRGGTDGKGKSQKMVRMTGSEYKKAIANRVNPKSAGRRVLLSSFGNKSDDDALVPPGFSPKHEKLGTRDSEDKDGQVRVKRLRNETDGKDKAQNVVRLTGSEYKKAFANRVSPKSLGKRLLLSTAGKNSDNDTLVPSVFPPKRNTAGTMNSDDEDEKMLAKHSRNETHGKDTAQRYSLVPPGFVLKHDTVGIRNSKNDVVSSDFPHKSNTVVTMDLDDNGGQIQEKSLRNETDGKEKAQKDSHLENPISSCGESIIVQNKQVEQLEIKAKSGNEKKCSKTLFGHETGSRPEVSLMDRFSDYGSSLKSKGAEPPPFCSLNLRPRLPIFIKAGNGAEALICKKFNFDTGNGQSCSLSSFEDPAMKQETRIQNLERALGLSKGVK